MRYGSVCSGIEAASVAWRPLGFKCAFVSETARFPSKLLKVRYPDVPNLGDFTKITPQSYAGDIDILVGGTPCQAFSRAGKKRGVEDERGNLAFEFARLSFRTRARYVVWENVTAVLASHRGADFAAFLSFLVGWSVEPPKDGWRKAGIVTNAPGAYSVGWRILDAQSTRVDEFPFGLPQRRKRLILVGYLGDWRQVARILFDGEMFSGNSAKSAKTRRSSSQGNRLCPVYPIDLTNLDGRTKHLLGKCYDADGTPAYTLTRRRPSGVCVGGVIRMLTPLECERVMGFPDNYTDIPWCGKAEAPKFTRYKAIGNSVSVNMMIWIGRQIKKAERSLRNGCEKAGRVSGEDANLAKIG